MVDGSAPGYRHETLPNKKTDRVMVDWESYRLLAD